MLITSGSYRVNFYSAFLHPGVLISSSKLLGKSDEVLDRGGVDFVMEWTGGGLTL